MDFWYPLRRLCTYVLSFRNSDSDNVVHPRNTLLFGQSDGTTNRTYPLDADIYLDEFCKYTKYAMTDLSLQNCVTRVEFCKHMGEDYLVAHIVYWFGGQTHVRHKSFAVIDIDRAKGRVLRQRSESAVEASPSTPAPAPTSPTSSPASPPRPPSPNNGASRHRLYHDTDNMTIYFRKRPRPKREVWASMDFDTSVPENLLSFERLMCIQSVGDHDDDGYWIAGWLWDALLLSKDLRPYVHVNDDLPGGHSLFGLDFLGMKARNKGEKHPCGALVRSRNVVKPEHLVLCDVEWEAFQVRFKKAIEEEWDQKTGLKRVMARTEEVKARAAVARAQSCENDSPALVVAEARLRAATEARVAAEAGLCAATEARVAAEARLCTARETLAALEAQLSADAETRKAQAAQSRALIESLPPTKSSTSSHKAEV